MIEEDEIVETAMTGEIVIHMAVEADVDTHQDHAPGLLEDDVTTTMTTMTDHTRRGKGRARARPRGEENAGEKIHSRHIADAAAQALHHPNVAATALRRQSAQSRLLRRMIARLIETQNRPLRQTKGGTLHRRIDRCLLV